MGSSLAISDGRTLGYTEKDVDFLFLFLVHEGVYLSMKIKPKAPMDFLARSGFHLRCTRPHTFSPDWEKGREIGRYRNYFDIDVLISTSKELQ